MTTFVATEAVDLSSLEEFGILNEESLDTATFAGDTSNIVVTVDDIEIKFTGSFPGVEGTPTQEDLELGTITGIDVSVEGLPRYQISGISMLGSALLGYVTAADPDAWIGNVLLAGDDTITGSIFADTLYGYGGADTITGGAGLDTIHGGDGNDILVIDHPGEVVAGEIYDGGDDNDTLKITSGADFDLSAVTISNIENLDFPGNAATLSLTAAQLGGFSGAIATGYAIRLTTAGIVDLTGQAVTTPIFYLSDFGNTLNLGGVADFTYEIHGGSSADVITGGDRFSEVGDTIDGGGGNDTLDGGACNDDLTGGAGDDTIDGGADHYDTAHYAGNRDDYCVVDNGDGTFTVTDRRECSPDGSDTLSRVEFLEFKDQRLFLGFGEPPQITSDGGDESASVDVAENVTLVTIVTASDADGGDPQIYSIVGGDDAGLFSIDEWSGELSFLCAPDYESPQDEDADNVYDVIVQVSDGNLTDTQSIAVTVSNRNEAPSIDSNGGGATATVNLLENAVAVTTVTAVDPDAGSPKNYSISGGADALKFSINAVTGALSFVAAPNFEAPTDAGRNNVYDVIVRVSDGKLADTQSIAVKVFNTGGVTINGSARNDVVDVASTVAGQPLPTREDDRINGLGGNDRLFGIDGNDIINGGLGNDVLKGGLGRDTLDGGVGSDMADYSDKVARVVVALDAAGNAVVRVGGVVEDTIRNVESLTGGAAGDALIGNGLANLLNGGGGADLLRGLGGNDAYVIDNAGDIADESATTSNGLDVVQSSVSFSLADSVHARGIIENLTLIGMGDINGTGNGLANVITGNSGNNTLSGGGGDDIMRGGAGNDIYVVNSPGDRVDEQLNGGAGTDTVRSSIGFSLAVSPQVAGAVENLVLANFVTALAATGNGLANVLTGNSFANVLDGGGGADTMRGGAGNDVYVVNHALDVVDELSNGGAGVFDMVRSSISFSLAGSAAMLGAVENLTLIGSGAIGGTGNALRNTISGNGATNVLDGGLGNDYLQGGLGNDVFAFSTALDSAANRDSIGDFANAAGNNDSFRLDEAIFTSLGLGALDQLSFRNGAAAADGNDFIVYDRASGALSYDADGNGAGLAVQFATLLNKPLLTASDFSVI